MIVDICLKQKLRWMVLRHCVIEKPQTIWSKVWEVFTKMAQSLHCYEYLWQRCCDFKKRIKSDSFKNKYNIV